MESTGVYWKPVYSVLEEIGIKVTLVNAIAHKMLVSIYHMLKNKTDYKDFGDDYLLKYKDLTE